MTLLHGMIRRLAFIPFEMQLSPEKIDIKLERTILEDIDNNMKTSQEKKDVESQSFSTSNQGIDSSAGPNSLNNYDYVEEIEKKV